MAFAEANLLTNRNLDALNAYQKIIRQKPDAIDAHIALVKIYMDLDLISEAKEEFEKIFLYSPSNPDPEAYFLYKIIGEKLNINIDQDLEKSPEISEVELLNIKLEIEQNALKKRIEYLGKLKDPNSHSYIDYLISETERKLKETILLNEFSTSFSKKEEKEKIEIELQIQKLEEQELVGEIKELSLDSINGGKIIEGILADIYSSKGILALQVFTDNGILLYHKTQNNLDGKKLAEILLKGKLNLKQSLQDESLNIDYWIFEGKDTMLILKEVTSKFNIALIGGQGSILGTLRYALEKNKGHLADNLKKIAEFCEM